MTDEPAVESGPPDGEAAGGSRRARIAAGVIFAAIVFVVVLVVLTGGKDVGEGAGRNPDSRVAGVTETAKLLDGIPQEGLTLGNPGAPVSIIEFIDLQCPYCAQHQNLEQPKVIREVIRTGQAKITFVPLAFIGPDSEVGRIVMLRLALKDRAWNFANLLFLNQGAENSGYMTDAYLQRLVAEIPGTVPADASRTTDQTLDSGRAQADTLGQAILTEEDAGTPYFIVGPSADSPRAYKRIVPGAGGSAADAIIAAVRAAAKQSPRASPGAPGPTSPGITATGPRAASPTA